MSKLLKLKQWLTVEEASDYLTSILGEPVRQHDIYRLAIDGSLRLSVVFLAEYHCRDAHKKTGEIHYETVPGIDGKSLVKIPVDGPTYEARNGDEYQMGEMVGYLSMDVPYWLPMIGGEIESVEHKYWEAQGVTRSSGADIGGVFVAEGEQIYRVEDRLGNDSISRGFYPVGALPDETVFVVTPSDLIAFQNTLVEEQKTTPEARRSHVAQVVERHGGNKEAAGRELGITGQRVGQIVGTKSKNDKASKGALPDPKGPFDQLIKRK